MTPAKNPTSFMGRECQFVGYSVKDWKAKHYPDGNHSYLNCSGKILGKIPDDVVVCDVCNVEIKQPEDDSNKKVVWDYDGGFEKGNWAMCAECKEHPERLEVSFKLLDEYKRAVGLLDRGDVSEAGVSHLDKTIHTEKELIEVMEPCLRETTKRMISKYGIDKWVRAMDASIKENYLKKNREGQWTVSNKAFIEGSGCVKIVEGEILDGQRRLK